MNQLRTYQFPTLIEVLTYPLLLVVLMWSVYLVQLATPDHLVQLGILPRHWDHWYGILFSPILHHPGDFGHIINNSIPAFLLTAALVYFYKESAGWVLLISWLCSGLFVWLFAKDNGSFHIGFSGVIYALAGYLFLGGILRKFRPYQAVSLFVVFMYGSMVWGIFPIEVNVSWEGHFSGLITGLILAVLFRKRGLQAPKYQYEIEKELGIEPPDLEGMWEENQRFYEEQLRLQQEAENANNVDVFTGSEPKIVYDFKPKKNDNQSTSGL